MNRLRHWLILTALFAGLLVLARAIPLIGVLLLTALPLCTVLLYILRQQIRWPWAAVGIIVGLVILYPGLGGPVAAVLHVSHADAPITSETKLKFYHAFIEPIARVTGPDSPACQLYTRYIQSWEQLGRRGYTKKLHNVPSWPN